MTILNPIALPTTLADAGKASSTWSEIQNATTPPADQPAPAGQPQTTPLPAAAPAVTAGSPPVIEQPARRVPQAPAFTVVIDAAHGGHDPGARIAPNLLEKDLTLALARKLRQELQARHIAATLLRDNDADMSFDQRAAAANLSRPSVFITVHAEPGSILRIYTPALNLADKVRLDRTGFLLWENAQSAFSAESAAFASSASNSVVKRELPAPVQPAFLQPLHSIAAPAIAIEVPATKQGFKISSDLIAGALADAVATRKMNLGGAK